MPGKINTLTLSIDSGAGLKRFKIEDEKNNPGKVIEVSFMKLTELGSMNILADAAKIEQEYITGTIATRTNPGTGKEETHYTAPKVIPPVKDEMVTLTNGTANFIATLMTAQHAPDLAYRYTVQEWAHILCVKYFRNELIAIVNEHIMADVIGDPGDWLDEDVDKENPLAPEGGEDSEPTSSVGPAKSTEPTPE